MKRKRPRSEKSQELLLAVPYGSVVLSQWFDDSVGLTSRCFPGLGFRGGDLIKYPLCGMIFAELSACVDSAKWL